MNNAGRALPMGPSEWMKIEDFESTLKVNMTGVIEMTMNFFPLVKKARGRVVNVASVLGRVAANGGGYCISKFAVESFSDCLRYHTLKAMFHPPILVQILGSHKKILDGKAKMRILSSIEVGNYLADKETCT